MRFLAPNRDVRTVVNDAAPPYCLWSGEEMVVGALPLGLAMRVRRKLNRAHGIRTTIAPAGRGAKVLPSWKRWAYAILNDKVKVTSTPPAEVPA